MKAISAPSSPVPAVAKIKVKLDEFRALEADFQNDKTRELAASALDSAKAAAVAAEAEDASIDPEQLVDRRIEARRQIEIAEIRLGRVQKAMESRGVAVNAPLVEAGKIAAKALRDSAEPFGQRLEAELRKLIGDDSYAENNPFFNALSYRKCERFLIHARQVESSPSPQILDQAIVLLQDASRLSRLD